MDQMSAPSQVAPGADLALAADQLERLAPGYLAQVRRAAEQLSLRHGPGSGLACLLDDMTDAARVDLEVPTLSRLRLGSFAKVGVKRLLGWYLRYLGAQVSDLGEAVVRFGAAVVERSESLEFRTARLEADLRSLSARVATLEQTPRGSG